MEERKAAGADVNWLEQGDGPTDFLFPQVDHNPRAPAVRVVIRHRVDQTIILKANGRLVDKVAFDGTTQAPGGRYAVSIWRGIPLERETTRLEAEVRDAKGGVVTVLTRDVNYTQGAARFELVAEKSRLIADGQSRPILALRVLDRNGRPVRAGSTGDFYLSAPYESAEALDSAQRNPTVRQPRGGPRWFVRGDDGMAYVELAPTMTSGKLSASFTVPSGRSSRQIELEAWVSPGKQPWTVIGLAEATVGAKSIAESMQRHGRFSSPLGENGRVAVYAKGPITSDILVTAAYDSARQKDDQNLMGTIDPRSYYTLFADTSDRRFDAASRDKLYARVEGKGFVANYGDIEAGFQHTELARYLRAATGLQGELTSGHFHLQGFAARIASVHRSDAFQGSGISGPYRLSRRAIIPGSETVTIEIRDRYRPKLVVSRRSLTRFIDYDLDLLSGTVTLREPLQSRDFDLNPQFVVVDYEIETGSSAGELNGGVRGEVDLVDGKLTVGANFISDKPTAGSNRTNLVAVDLKAKLTQATQVRAELGKTFATGTNSTAWLIEAEHHDGRLDVLGYARSAAPDFGFEQQSGVEVAWRKVGADLNYRLSDSLSFDANAWRADSLIDAAQRTALQLGARWQQQRTDARLGLAFMRDRLGTGDLVQSTILEGAVTRRLFDNRLELSASSSIALDQIGALDLPARHRFTARYAITPDIRLTGSYELAKGQGVEARTAQAGIELTPWSGASLRGVLGQELSPNSAARSYAGIGLSQSVPLTSNLLVTATIDSNRTLSFDANRLLDAQHPAASGGHIGGGNLLAEDFTAATLGATWRQGLWAATVRGEWRNGETEDRTGFMVDAVRQMGDGSALGSTFTWTYGQAPGGATSRVMDAALTFAYRPSGSELNMLGKLEFRSDQVTGAVAGGMGPIGGTALTISGDGKSERLIASVSGAWTPHSYADAERVERHEIGFFAAVRRNLDYIQGYDLYGTTLLGGLDARYGIASRLDVGLGATVRANLSDRTVSYAIGPQIGFTPAKDLLLLLGYNFAGFNDPDFAVTRSTINGVFVSLRLKFDENSLSRIGINPH